MPEENHDFFYAMLKLTASLFAPRAVAGLGRLKTVGRGVRCGMLRFKLTINSLRNGYAVQPSKGFMCPQAAH